MNLPFLKKKEETKEFFLVLLLSSGKVGSILFEKTGEELVLLSRQEETLSDPLDSIEPNKLIESSDVVISDAELKLPEGAHLEKTIFAIPQRWVEDGKIKKDHLATLKKLCEALELTPVGFVVSIEALTTYLHKKEGVPVTAIFVEVGEKHVTVSIVKNGEILQVLEKDVDENVIHTTEQVLLEQEVAEVLPSKIILLNFDDALKTQQGFLSHSWSKSLAFLHIPQVEILDTEVESQAVINGVANQMGFAGVVGSPVLKASSQASTPQEETVLEDPTLGEPETPPAIQDSAPEFSPEAVGFFAETDVAKQKVTEESHVGEPVIRDHADNPESPLHDENEANDQAVTAYEEKESMFSKLKLPFPVPSIAGFLPSGSKFYIYPILAIVGVLVLGFLYYFMFETATVTLYLDKKVITKDMPITFSTEKSSSVEDGILQIQTRQITVEGEESKSATGTKETGEKAKGEVTIFNKTENKKTFEKGAILVGPNNLTFVLTDAVEIASTSAFSTSFSSSKGKVEAAKFGKEYNLPSNTNFSFEDVSTSDYFAKNEQAFSGGVSRELTVVSVEDLSDLDTALVQKLTKNAVEKAQSEKDPEEDILLDPVAFEFQSKKYSAKEGEETSNVSLSGSIVFDIGVYKKSDLLSFAKEASQNEVEDGSEFSQKDSEVTVRDITEEDGETSGTFVFKSVFLQKIETGDLAGKVAGKNSDTTYEILDQNGVADVQVEFNRALPFLPKILPFNKENITIELKPAE